MSIGTHSRFYFGYTITNDNNAIDFSEGGGELQATLDVGNYSLTELLIEIKKQLDATGAETYTANVNRVTRKITISATGTFELKVSSGSRVGTTAYTLLGYNGADLTGASTYEADSGAGLEYTTQYILQSYVPSEHWVQAADAKVNRTASGRVEVFQFGQEKFYELDFQYITEIEQDNHIIRNRPSGLSEFLTFFSFLITKGKVEFMPNESDQDTFETVILESAPGSKDGTGFKLRELFDRGLPGYYNTGKIKMRVVD